MEVNEMSTFKKVNLVIIEILPELPTLDFSRENPVNGPVLEQCRDIGTPLRSIRIQIIASDRAQAISGSDDASVHAVEVFMWNPDASVDHGPAKQITSGPSGGTDNDLGADLANGLIEGFAVDL